MRKTAFVNTSAVLFAAAGAATSPKPAGAATSPKPLNPAPIAAATEAVKPSATKPEIKVLAASSAVPLPTNRKGGKRGNKALYDLSGLLVGQSLPIIGRKAKNLTSTISTNNRADEFAVFKRDENGNVEHETIEVKGADGAVVGTKKGAAIVVSRRVFFAHDCDPKTDPEGADVRIFRAEDKTV